MRGICIRKLLPSPLCFIFFHLVLNFGKLFFFKDIQFAKVYSNAPSVFVSANHSSSGGNKDPMRNSITAWVEVRQRTDLL